MPALSPIYPCEVCGNSHTLDYAGIGPSPDLSKPEFFTCPRLPVAMRITGWAVRVGEREAFGGACDPPWSWGGASGVLGRVSWRLFRF
jgi:hypothetical protein